MDYDIDKMVDYFLMWPLPDSVSSDKCVTIQGYHDRIGTNLLTATEAKQMFKYVFTKAIEANQRERMTERFSGRKVTEPSADSDFIAPNDIED